MASRTSSHDARPELIREVLMLTNPEHPKELYSSLWTSFDEIGAFFGELLNAKVSRDDVSNQKTLLESLKSAQGKFFKTFEAGHLCKIVNEHLENVIIEPLDGVGTEARSGGFTRQTVATRAERPYTLLVTDLQLTPPEDWRFIIWDGDKHNTAVSICPIDPTYWRIEDEPRIPLIKHRARVACLSTLGERIGLKRCDNARCFLYRQVESIRNLDHMVVLGAEHRIQWLTNKGFEVIADNPSVQQPIIENPEPYYA